MFEVMDKVESDSDSDYADFLLSAVEYNKKQFIFRRTGYGLQKILKQYEALRKT